MTDEIGCLNNFELQRAKKRLELKAMWFKRQKEILSKPVETIEEVDDNPWVIKKIIIVIAED